MSLPATDLRRLEREEIRRAIEALRNALERELEAIKKRLQQLEAREF